VFVTELATNWKNDELLYDVQSEVEDQISYATSNDLRRILVKADKRRRGLIHIVHITSYAPKIFEDLLAPMFIDFGVNLFVTWEKFLLDSEDPMCVSIENNDSRAEETHRTGFTLGYDRKFTERAQSLILGADAIYLLPNFSISDNADTDNRDELVIRLVERVKHIRGDLRSVTAAFHSKASMNHVSGLSNSIAINEIAQGLLINSVLKHSGIHSLFGLISSYASFTTLNIASILHSDGVELPTNYKPRNGIDNYETKFMNERRNYWHNMRLRLLQCSLLLAGQQLLQVMSILPKRLEGMMWTNFVEMMKSEFEICVLFLVVKDQSKREGYLMPPQDFRLGTSCMDDGRKIRGILVICNAITSISKFYDLFRRFPAKPSSIMDYSAENDERSDSLEDDLNANGYAVGCFCHKAIQKRKERIGNREYFKDSAERIERRYMRSECERPNYNHIRIRDYTQFTGESINSQNSDHEIIRISDAHVLDFFPIVKVGKSMLSICLNSSHTLTLCKNRQRSNSLDPSTSFINFHRERFPEAYEKAFGADRPIRINHFLNWPQNLDLFLQCIVQTSISNVEDDRMNGRLLEAQIIDFGATVPPVAQKAPSTIMIVIMVNSIPRELINAMLSAPQSSRVKINLVVIPGNWTDRDDLIWTGIEETNSVGLQCTSTSFRSIDLDVLWQYILSHKMKSFASLSAQSDTPSGDHYNDTRVTGSQIPSSILTYELDKCPLNSEENGGKKFFDETVLRTCLLINEIHQLTLRKSNRASMVQLDFVPTGYLFSTMKNPPLDLDKASIQAVLEGKCLTVEMLYGMCVQSSLLKSLPDINQLTEYITLHNMFDVEPLTQGWVNRNFRDLWDHYRKKGKIIIALHLYSFDEVFVERLINIEYSQLGESFSGATDDNMTIPQDRYPHYTWAVSPNQNFIIPSFPCNHFPPGFVVFVKRSNVVNNQTLSGFSPTTFGITRKFRLASTYLPHSSSSSFS